MTKNRLFEKFKESLAAVLPIVFIVLILSFTITPLESGTLLTFLVGSALLIFGMVLFSLGSELAMEPMGERLGARITASKKLPLVLILTFAIGFMIAITEPDLQVLAGQMQAIPPKTLILTIACGVGLFLLLAVVRMLIGMTLRTLLLISYAIIFILCIFAPPELLPVSFDAGGVTTGPMVVPFVMAFGIGISSIRRDKHAADDSFGLVSLCTAGPIVAVLLLGVVFKPDSIQFSETLVPNVEHSLELSKMFLSEIPNYLKEMASALFPLCVFYGVFQLITRSVEKRALKRIVVGVLYTFFGLSIFLTGVNVGFMPVGYLLGSALAGYSIKWIVVPVGMLIGYFIVKAEPAVPILIKQVEELTDGQISGKSLNLSLSIGVSVSVGLAMIRAITGISILWLVVPGYFIAFLLSFFVPRIFTAIAFDSGSVASGPMTATFLVAFAMGACAAVGGNIASDAFGAVAMVAMTPVITMQIFGVVYKMKSKGADIETVTVDVDDYAIIELM
jgi:hypothetical protein